MNIKKFMYNYLSKEILPYELYKKSVQIKDINTNEKEEKKPKTLLDALKQAEKEFKEILGDEYSYIQDELDDEPLQKIKK